MADRKNDNGNKATETVKLPLRLERAQDSVDHVLAAGKHVTLDFGDCDFISVDGIEWLEEILLRSESLKSKITFVNLNPKLYKVFKVAHIDSLQKACGAPGPAAGPVC
jgi:anti-anti-sigma regulatory factor